jgi:hypothetical protein
VTFIQHVQNPFLPGKWMKNPITLFSIFSGFGQYFLINQQSQRKTEDTLKISVVSSLNSLNFISVGGVLNRENAILFRLLLPKTRLLLAMVGP